MSKLDDENLPAGLSWLDRMDRGYERLEIGIVDDDDLEDVEVQDATAEPVRAMTHVAVDGNPVAPAVIEGDPSKIKTTVIILTTGALFAFGLIGIGLLIVKALS